MQAKVEVKERRKVGTQAGNKYINEQIIVRIDIVVQLVELPFSGKSKSCEQI